MTLLYSNVQSINNKINEMRALVEMERPDVIVLTETWTHEGIDDAFLQIAGYEMAVRSDRRDTAGGRGGGIIVYSRGLHVWQEKTNTDFNQCVTLKVKKQNRECALHVVYRSPNSTRCNDEKLCDWIRTIDGSNREAVVVGDFNFPKIDWVNGKSDARGREFLESCMDVFLVQHVTSETHRSGNVLDLLLTTEESMVDSIRMIGKIGSCDHEAMLVDLKIKPKWDEMTKVIRNYNRGNYDEMRKMMRIDWEKELANLDVERTWVTIEHKIAEAIDECIPEKRVVTRGKPRWMTGEIAKTIKLKRNAWTRWKQTRSETEKNTYRKLEAKVKKMIRNEKKAFEKKLAKDAKANPKAFFSYLNSQRKTRPKIGPIKDGCGGIVTEPSVQANIFNAHYASVFTKSDDQPPSKEKVTDETIEDVEFSVETVKNLIIDLRDSASPGPDGIGNRVLKELRNELAHPLCILFRRSLDDGVVPSTWKESIISPIFKKGDKGEPVNYRPVNLTSNVCKLMERILKRGIEEHLERNVLKNSQHGFRSGRSCQTNLIEFQDKITRWIDDGKSVDVMFFDLSKAFDKVDHKCLAVKMEAAGIVGKLQKWIKEWLRDRKQQVRVADSVSGWEEVESSTPQGTVLGGTLFSIYIDDVDDEIESFARKFADDTKAANVVETEGDARRMQRDVDKLMEWAKTWRMVFNAEKCKVLHLGRKNQRFEYMMDGKRIQAVEEEKDLGVWVSDTMKPSIQCERAARDANAALGMIMRSFHYRTKDILIPLYKTFVRPKLEFAVSAWRPWQQGDIDQLEKVQKRMLRMVSNVRGGDYEDRLRMVGLTTLEERRARGDMVETFKTLNGKNRVEMAEWFEVQEEEARPTRLNTLMVAGDAIKKQGVLVGQKANRELRRNFFTVRVVNEWNSLPEEVKAVKSTNAFKNAYDRWFMDKKSKNEIMNLVR